MPLRLTLRIMPFVLAVAVSAGIIATSPAVAANERAVEDYTCKEVMRESGVNRNSAIAFLHGFVLGKSGSTKFSIEALTKQTDAFVDGCLDQPKAKALDVMMKAKS